jgi:transposase
MANRLSVAKVHSILTLRARGWSYRRIAKALGIDRETVRSYVHQARAPDSKPATPRGQAPTGSDGQAPTGSTGPDASGGACGGPPGSPLEGDASELGTPPREASACSPHRDVILAKLDQGLSAVRIHQDLTTEFGQAAPSYYSVRRYVRRIDGGHAMPFRRMECEPGVEAQVDFGTGAPVVSAQGRRRRTHVLRIVLSHSRKAYSEVVFRQTTDDFLRCLEHAFHHFGGVPTTLILDNLRAAVTKADWFDPEINPKVQSFCAHYGIAPLPTKPRMPRHKGKTERGVDYVQENCLKGHTFRSLQEQNEHVWHWEATVADTRIHGTTKRQVKQVFEQIERPALQPLAVARFAFFQEAQRCVHRDGHVEVAKAYYSVPPEYLGRRLWVRWDAHMVRIFDGRMHPIAVHARKEEGRFSTQNSHILAEKINRVERGAAWLLEKVGCIGVPTRRWAEAMVQQRGIEGVRVLQGLLSLANKHSAQQIDKACEVALSHQAWRLRTIRELIKRYDSITAEQESFDDFIDEHPIIRSLDDYSQFVHDAFVQPSY